MGRAEVFQFGFSGPDSYRGTLVQWIFHGGEASRLSYIKLKELEE